MLKTTLVLFSLVAATCAWSTTCPNYIEAEKLCMDFEWVEGPKFDVYSKARLTFYREENNKKVPVAPAKDVDVYPWMIMANMEHGARPVVTTKISTGILEVSKIYFSNMPGHWEMRVRHADNPDKKNPLVKVKVVFP